MKRNVYWPGLCLLESVICRRDRVLAKRECVLDQLSTLKSTASVLFSAREAVTLYQSVDS